MFIAGFLFPFGKNIPWIIISYCLTIFLAWMIASFLPLPVKPVMEMEERDHSTSNLDNSNDNHNDYARRFGPMDESRYESAKWWRTLNRWMSLAGILILAAVVSSRRLFYHLALNLCKIGSTRCHRPPRRLVIYSIHQKYLA